MNDGNPYLLRKKSIILRKNVITRNTLCAKFLLRFEGICL
jgi:hypothetical protein